MIRHLAVLVVSAFVLVGCGTTDSALQQEGRSPAYIMGFHDGRHSGMREEGNPYETYIKDAERFESDPDYKAGWLAGEAEGRELQAQATAVGNAAAGAYTADQIDKEMDRHDPDKVARDAVKGVDTDALKVLEK